MSKALTEQNERHGVQGGYGLVFAVQACPDRAAGERHGYKFCELYECRACPAFANQKRGYKVDQEQEKSQGTQSFITGTGAVAV